MAENIDLNSMMDKRPRTSGTGKTMLDLTKGKVVVESAEDSAPKQEAPAAAPEAPKKMRADVIQTGPVVMENMIPMDLNSILPKRAPEQTSYEATLFAELDAAIAREKESITERVDKITEMQREEFERKMEEEENKKLELEDISATAIGVSTMSTPIYDEGDTYGLYEDEDNDEPMIDPRHISPIPATKDETVESTEIIAAKAPEYTDVIVPKTRVEEVIPDPEPVIHERSENVVRILDNVENDDLFDDEEESEATDTDDSFIDNLRKEVKEKISPIRKTFDLSKFTIAKKAISAQKVMKTVVQSNQNIADWIMYGANRPLSVSGLSGPEILKLNPENSNRNRLNTFRDMYRVIYDHVIDGNKPDFETWLKQLRFVDLQHIYFALYMATFGGSNFVNYACEKCNKVFLQDVKFEDMVVYASDEVKEKVRSILKMDTTSPYKDEYNVDLVQISDSYVFGLRTPSIWNVIIETASLSDQFIEKHADLIDVISYIDSIYYIDEANQTLVAIDTKPDANDQAKTAARRVKAFYDIIRTLSSEEFYNLRFKISAYDEGASQVTYQIPECTCPQCGEKIAANSTSPDSMLFTRHQLAAIGNT